MYQALYRRYRPSTFGDVVGQDAITAVLKKEIELGRISHAYLFCGTRGTGKTTCAKILAKAVNCEHPAGGEPCNKCDSCLSIEKGSNIDVSEIDAASNNGVEDVRGIRDEAVYTPAMSRYRVYIIDEVHMLSGSAFNALLKTLEEPPAHVIFILATTEFHKLPATIVSRCQRFDFKRIEASAATPRIKAVAASEGLEITDEAAELISRFSAGSMRDMLSILDQCATGGGAVDQKTVLSVLGVVSRDRMISLCENCCSGDFKAAAGALARFYADGLDLARLCSSLIGCYRDMMMLKTLGADAGLLACPPEEIAALSKLAKQHSLERITSWLDTLLECETRLKTSFDKRTELEMCLLTLCRPGLLRTPAELAARIERLERVAVPARKEEGKTKTKAEFPDEPPSSPAGAATDESPSSSAGAAPDESPSSSAGAATDERRVDAGLSAVKTALPPPLRPLFAKSKCTLSGSAVIVTSATDLEYSLLSKPQNLAAIADAFSAQFGAGVQVRVVKPERAGIDDPFSALADKIESLER